MDFVIATALDFPISGLWLRQVNTSESSECVAVGQLWPDPAGQTHGLLLEWAGISDYRKFQPFRFVPEAAWQAEITVRNRGRCCFARQYDSGTASETVPGIEIHDRKLLTIDFQIDVLACLIDFSGLVRPMFRVQAQFAVCRIGKLHFDSVFRWPVPKHVLCRKWLPVAHAAGAPAPSRPGRGGRRRTQSFSRKISFYLFSTATALLRPDHQSPAAGAGSNDRRRNIQNLQQQPGSDEVGGADPENVSAPEFPE